MNRDTYSETGDWIADVVRSKPEALLLLAAGCALLLRGSGSASASNMTNAAGAAMSNAGGAARDQADALHQQSSRATQGLYRAAESATVTMPESVATSTTFCAAPESQLIAAAEPGMANCFTSFCELQT